MMLAAQTPFSQIPITVDQTINQNSDHQDLCQLAAPSSGFLIVERNTRSLATRSLDSPRPPGSTDSLGTHFRTPGFADNLRWVPNEDEDQDSMRLHKDPVDDDPKLSHHIDGVKPSDKVDQKQEKKKNTGKKKKTATSEVAKKASERKKKKTDGNIRLRRRWKAGQIETYFRDVCK